MKLDALTPRPFRRFRHQFVLLFLFAAFVLMIGSHAIWVASAESSAEESVAVLPAPCATPNGSPKIFVNYDDFLPYIRPNGSTRRISVGITVPRCGPDREIPSSGTITVTLPSYATFASGIPPVNGNGTVTGGGQTVVLNHTRMIANLDGLTAGINFQININVPLTANAAPDIPPMGSVHVQAEYVYPTQGGDSVSYVRPAPFGYSKLRATTTRTQPADVGDEIPYTLHTSGYPHLIMRSSRVTITAPSHTEFVPGSVSGGGTATITGNQLVVELGQLTGAAPINFKIKVLPTLTPSTRAFAPGYQHRITLNDPDSDNDPPNDYVLTGTLVSNQFVYAKPTIEMQWVAVQTNVPLDGEITVKARVKNLSPALTLTNVQLGGSLTYSGEGLAQLVTPAPAPISIAPGQTADIDYRFRGTRAGKFRITGDIRGSASTGTFFSIPATSPELCVGCSEVELEIETPTTRLKVGDTFPAKVRVTSHLADPTTITLADPLLKEVPQDELPANAILAVDPPDTPAPFELTREQPSRIFTAVVKVNRLGVTDLVSSLSYTKPTGPEEVATSKKIEISPFLVTADVTPRTTTLNQTSPERKSPRCREIEAVPNGPKNCIELIATVKNIGTQPITNVKIPEAADPLKMINETNPLQLSEPLRPLESELLEGPLTLEPGAEVTWVWRLDAFDAPASLKFQPVVTGVLNGLEVGGSGEKRFSVVDNVLLKWGMRPTEGRTDYPSGQVIRADGYIENTSAANGAEGKLLRVLVYPMPDKNAGGGFVHKATYNGPTPNDYQFFDVPHEGADKRIDLKAAFRTLRTLAPSSGKAAFGVRMVIVEKDGTLTPASDQVELDEDYMDEFWVNLAPEQFVESDYNESCLAQGYPPSFCSYAQGGGEFVDGLHGLTQFTLYSLEKTGEGGVRTASYGIWAIKEVGKTVLGDPQAREALAQDLYVQYLTFYNLGVMGGQVAGQVPMAYEQFSISVFESMGRFFEDVEQGDIASLQDKTAHFLGANPDMIFEVFAVGRGITKLASQMRDTSGSIAENVTTVAVRDKAIREASSVDARVAAAKADPNNTDLSKALATGDVLTPSLLRDVFGVSEETAKKLHDFAKKNQVILAFRSRSRIAQTLIDNGLAWPKPQALKFKTVNEIDMRFLGYRRQAEGTIEIVEPPAGILGKEGAELKSACDAYMDVLVSRNPELAQNPVLRAETRKRLETRAKEWNKYVPKMKLNDLNADVKVGVAFEANMQWARDVSGDVGKKSYRKIERTDAGTITDQVTNQPRRVWEIKMEGPNGAAAKPVTGDIDFLGILDKYGRFIRDDKKRIALYEQMQEWMEHGESMSFRYDDVRLENLLCCVDGAEAMLTVGPWDGPPRAGRFVNNLSVMNEFNTAFKRVRGVEPTLGPAGELQYNADGSLVGTTIRMEDPTGEFALINGTPLLHKADETFVHTFAPLIFEQVYQEFLTRAPYYWPGLIIAKITGNEGEELSKGNRAGSEAVPFRRGAPVIQLERVADIELVEPSQLLVWTLEEGWQPISPKDAFAAGDPTIPDIAPNSQLLDNASAGSTRIRVSSLQQIEASGDFFQAGDWVVLDPGGHNQEIAMIVNVSPLTLAAPLKNDHNVGEMVAWIEAPEVGVAVGGQVRTAEGRPIANAFVTITDPKGTTRTARTNSFGHFRFVDIGSGRIYTISVRARRYEFEPRQISVGGDLANVDFTPIMQEKAVEVESVEVASP